MKFIPTALLAILLGVLMRCDNANHSTQSAGATVPDTASHLPSPIRQQQSFGM
jgi:hypothetical protein